MIQKMFYFVRCFALHNDVLLHKQRLKTGRLTHHLVLETLLCTRSSSAQDHIMQHKQTEWMVIVESHCSRALGHIMVQHVGPLVIVESHCSRALGQLMVQHVRPHSGSTCWMDE